MPEYLNVMILSWIIHSESLSLVVTVIKDNIPVFSCTFTSVHLLETNLDTKTPEAHVKRSILVRTVETRDGEVGDAPTAQHNSDETHTAALTCLL